MDDIHTTGAIVFWKLYRSYPVREVIYAWNKTGCSNGMPPVASDLVCLRYALQTWSSYRGSERVLIRPLAGRSGYSIVDESAGPVTVHHHPRWSVRIGPDRSLEYPAENPGYETSSALGITYTKMQQGRVTRDALSLGLARTIIPHLHGYPLRDARGAGGVYWIPESSRAAWATLGKALGGRLTALRVASDAESIDELVTLVTQGVTDDLASLTGSLNTISEGYAIDRRIAQAREIYARVEGYEQTLGRNLEALRLAAIAAENTVSANVVAEVVAPGEVTGADEMF